MILVEIKPQIHHRYLEHSVSDKLSLARKHKDADKSTLDLAGNTNSSYVHTN